MFNDQASNSGCVAREQDAEPQADGEYLYLYPYVNKYTHMKIIKVQKLSPAYSPINLRFFSNSLDVNRPPD